MWLQRLSIDNYRSIEHAEVDFDPGFNAIFGENGTGKSNLVRSILKLLGPTYPGAHSFAVSDHLHADESREIRIALTFKDPTRTSTLSWEPTGGGGSRLLLDGRGVKDAERETLCPIYFPANREVRELPGQNSWNPLGRILSELSELIRANQPVRTAFDAKASELNQVLEASPEFAEFKRKLREYAAAHLGRTGSGLDLHLSLVDPEEALRTMQVFELQNGRQYNASTSGMGVQSGIVMGALRAFASVAGGRFFVVADEPEAYLHPLSQQALRLVFEALASSGTQVIVTTHSPHFISSDSLQGLHKVWLDGGATRVLRYRYADHLALLGGIGVTAATEESVKARLSHHLSVEAREGLFAKVVVLCEGESEAGSLGLWAKAMGNDFPTEGIAVVPTHGKFSLPTLALFYKALKLPTFVVFDSDSTKTGRDRTKHAETNKLILKISNAQEEEFPTTGAFSQHAVFAPDFEKVVRSSDQRYGAQETQVNEELGLRPDGAKGTRARYVALAYREAHQSTPTPIADLVRAIEAFRSSGGAIAH